MIVSAACGVVALVLLIQRDFDAAFTVAAIGTVSWFLSYRAQMKGLIDPWEDLDQDVKQDEEDDRHHH